MSMREIQFNDDADYEAAAAGMNAIWPEIPMTGGVLRKEDAACKKAGLVRRCYAAEQDGAMIGFGSFQQPTDYWFQRPGRFEMRFGVREANRRQGIGTQLYERMMADLEEYHPAEVVSFTTEDRVDGMRFLEQRDFQEAMRSCESLLDIGAFDVSRFSETRDRVQAEGVEIRSFSELASEAGRDAKLYALDRQLMQDVPSPGDQPDYTLEDWQKKHSTQNPDFLPGGMMVAIYEGRYIGLSELYQRGDTDLLETGLTGVLPNYRRKGIALALKVRALTYAKTLGKSGVITWNEAHNPMFDLNARLGFVKRPDVILYTKRLI